MMFLGVPSIQYGCHLLLTQVDPLVLELAELVCSDTPVLCRCGLAPQDRRHDVQNRRLLTTPESRQPVPSAGQRGIEGSDGSLVVVGVGLGVDSPELVRSSWRG